MRADGVVARTRAARMHSQTSRVNDHPGASRHPSCSRRGIFQLTHCRIERGRAGACYDSTTNMAWKPMMIVSVLLLVLLPGSTVAQNRSLDAVMPGLSQHIRTDMDAQPALTCEERM